MSTEHDGRRRRILECVLKRGRGALANATDVAGDLGIPPEVAEEEFGILEHLGCLRLSPVAAGWSNAMITPVGTRWVREGVSPESAAAQVNVGNIIERVTGGTVQGIGSAPGATFSQLAADPAACRAEVEALTERLLAEVRDELQAGPLLAYARAIEDLRRELAADEPEPTAVRRLLGTLAFFGDVEGTLGLTLRAWPHISGLLAIAAAVAGR